MRKNRDFVKYIIALINYTGGVTVIVGANYNIGITGPPNVGDQGGVSISVSTINGVNLTVPPNDGHFENTNGSYTGQLSTEFTILACPCSFVFDAKASAVAGGGGQSLTTDPFFIQLPPGWTYTLSSQAAVVPEPGSLALIGLVALIVGGRLVRKW